MILSNLMKECFATGKDTFVETIKTSLYQIDNNIFDGLDFYNDDIYLEPLLFTNFTQSVENRMPLSQILYKHLEQEEIDVQSNSTGQVYLGNKYYLNTSHKNEKFHLQVTNDKVLDENGESYKEIPLVFVRGQIELCAYEIPGLTRFYNNWNTTNPVIPVTIDDDLYERCKILIEKALALLEEACPDFYNYCIKSTQKIVMFNSPEIPGFVTREAHGTIFLTVHDEVNEAYFIDEIVHQCGHNIFNTITSRISDFIKIDPATRLLSLVKKKSGHDTSIDGAYHGLFTVCTGVQVLHKIYEKKFHTLDQRNRHELKGRLGVKYTRFRSWTEDVDMETIFTDKGLQIYRELDGGAHAIISNAPEIFKLDFSNQPYTFTYKKFLELNAI